MEVGAVKHQLNNEMIHLKKKLNQAKVQLIHKLTRRANTLKSQKKVPENLQAKLKRKADSAVAEVLILKKVQPKELIRFAISHKGKLEDFINKSTVDNERVYAKILIHKAMNEKYKSLRELFSNMPVDQLLMTRKERLRLKKAKKEENTKKKQNENSVIDSQEDSTVCKYGDGGNNSNEDDHFDNSNEEDEESQSNSDNTQENENSDKEEVECKINPKKLNFNKGAVSPSPEENKNGNINKSHVTEVKAIKSPQKKKELSLTDHINQTKTSIQKKDKKVSKSKPKEKKLSKKSRKQDTNLTEEQNIPLQAKVIDSFFMTVTGDHYMTLAEPRAPDEVKEEHYRGNRKMRRAEQFGKPIKPYKNDSIDSKNFKNSKYEKQHSNFKNNDLYSENNGNFSAKRKDYTIDSVPNKSVSGLRNSEIECNSIDKRKSDSKVEKLHPSWEAKKQKSGIVQFEGKKVLFS